MNKDEVMNQAALDLLSGKAERDRYGIFYFKEPGNPKNWCAEGSGDGWGGGKFEEGDHVPCASQLHRIGGPAVIWNDQYCLKRKPKMEWWEDGFYIESSSTIRGGYGIPKKVRIKSSTQIKNQDIYDHNYLVYQLGDSPTQYVLYTHTVAALARFFDRIGDDKDQMSSYNGALIEHIKDAHNSRGKIWRQDCAGDRYFINHVNSSPYGHYPPTMRFDS